MSILQIIALILEVLLGVFSAYAAYTLFAWAPPSITQARDLLRYPRWYWVLAGCMASIGAIGLFVGLLVPVVAVLGAAWMVAYFIVASFTHLYRKDFATFAMPLFFLVPFIGLLALRWGDVTPILAAIGR